MAQRPLHFGAAAEQDAFEGLAEDAVRASLERQLAEANPIYGEMVKDGLVKPARILFSQPETYLLYKEMMLEKGNAIAQIKPVTVIGNEAQKNFFFTLVDDFEEVKDQCPQVPPCRCG